MFNIKTRARILVKGKSFSSLLLGLCPVITAFSAFFCLIVGSMCVFYGNSAVLGTLKIYSYIQNLNFGIPVFFILSAFFLFVFTLSVNSVKKAYFFHLSDKNSMSPLYNISVKSALREGKKTALLFLIKALWFLCFFCPFFLCTAFIMSGLNGDGISKNNFFILTVLSLTLLITGFVFFLISMCRFFLTDYILFTNPKISALEAIRGSVLLTQGKTAVILKSKLSLIPWKLSGVFLFLLPFSYTYTSLINALLQEKCYGENKTTMKKEKKAAVTFIINKNSKINKVN